MKNIVILVSTFAVLVAVADLSNANQMATASLNFLEKFLDELNQSKMETSVETQVGKVKENQPYIYSYNYIGEAELQQLRVHNYSNNHELF